MSKPNPKRGAKSSTRKTARDADKDDAIDRTQSKSAIGAANAAGTSAADNAETKDETASNGDKKDAKTDGEATTPIEKPKPPSAGAIVRDAGQKLLGLTMRQEWNSIDPVIKQLEKIVSTTGDSHTNPLAGVKDPVSISHCYEIYIEYVLFIDVNFISYLVFNYFNGIFHDLNSKCYSICVLFLSKIFLPRLRVKLYV